MARLDGKVAFITGAARGQGRSHALRLAADGADVIAVDICAPVQSVGYPMPTPEDLAETGALVEKLGRRAFTRIADVRDYGALSEAFQAGLAELGRVDIVLANAGIMIVSPEPDPDTAAQHWSDAIGVMLTGAWNTVRVAAPTMVEQGDGGAIVLTSSTAGLKGLGVAGGPSPSGAGDGYVAAKHGVIGLMRNFAVGLAKHNIRANVVVPTGTNTPMVINEVFMQFVQENPEVVGTMSNLLPVPIIEPEDVSNAIAWLVSDEARYVTGVVLPVDAGFTAK